MDIFLGILTALGGYLLGSVNCAILMARHVMKADIREYGSGNAGATNAARTMGWKAGLLVTLGDALKGVLAVLAGGLLLGESGRLLAGFFCVIGHVAPVFFQFRGGKGVATAAAVYAMLHWQALLLALAVFLAAVLATRYVSLGSILAAVVYPIFVLLLPGTSWALFAVSLLVSGLVIFLHRENIKRLLRGTEHKFSLKRP